MVSTRRTAAAGSLVRLPEKGNKVERQSANPLGKRRNATAPASTSALAPKTRTQPAGRTPKTSAKGGTKKAAAPSARGSGAKRAAAAKAVNGKKAKASSVKGRKATGGKTATKKGPAKASGKKRKTHESGKATKTQTTNALGKRKRGATSASETTGSRKKARRTLKRPSAPAVAPTEAGRETRTRSTRNSNRGELMRIDESGNAAVTQESNPLQSPRRGESSTTTSLRGTRGRGRGGRNSGAAATAPGTEGEDFIIFEDEPGTPPGSPPVGAGLVPRTTITTAAAAPNATQARTPSTIIRGSGSSSLNDSNQENIAPRAPGILSRFGGITRSLFGGTSQATPSSNQNTRRSAALLESDPDDEPAAEGEEDQVMGEDEDEGSEDGLELGATAQTYAAYRAQRQARFNGQMEARRREIDASHLQATRNLSSTATSQQRLGNLQSALGRTQTASRPAGALTQPRSNDVPRRLSEPTGTRPSGLGSPFAFQSRNNNPRPRPTPYRLDDLYMFDFFGDDDPTVPRPEQSDEQEPDEQEPDEEEPEPAIEEGPRRGTLSPNTIALVDQFGAERNEISDDRIRP